MFGSTMLDVLIGLVVVYLLLSLMCSAIRESIAGIRGARSKMLALGIRELLHNDDPLIRAVYAHPQVWSLYRGDYDSAVKSNTLPSYIPSRSFAMTLLDLAARGLDSASAIQSGPEAPSLSVANVRRNIGNLRNPQVQRVVLAAVDGSGGDLERAGAAVESWFNSSMERVSGRYKRETQGLLLVIGFVMTVLLDVDSLRIARELYRDPAKRQAAVAMASSVVREAPAGTSAATVAATAAAADTQAVRALRKLDSLGLPEAWSDVHVTGLWPDPGEWKPLRHHVATSWFGWLITAFAISFGAPFWFDALGKLIAIRSTVKPKESAPPPPPTPTPTPTPIQSAATPASPPPRPPGAGTAQRHEWATGRPDGGIL